MTKAQQLTERVDALIAGGTSKGDAYKQVAEEFGLKPNSVRGAYYTHTRKDGSGTSRSRRRETTTADAVADAVATLQKALEAIDREVEAAKDRAEEAAREYAALKDSATDRKAAIEAKIEALTS